jgi:uracil-DNA glycosylase family 4
VSGAGVRDATIAFVGEGPGQVEDDKNRPFVGKAGRVLHVIQWAAGIDQYKVFHTNATRCWGKRNPKPAEVDACHDYLIEELRELNPTVIVALGGAAIRSLYRPGITVGSVMGFTLYNDELPGTPIIPTYHPSYIMRGHWNEVALVISHFRKAKRIAEAGGIEEKLGSYVGVTTLEDLRALRDYLLGPDVESIAIDTETTGLSWMDSELLCISFSGEVGTGFSVPILHRGERTVMKEKGRGKNRKEVEETEWCPVPYWPDDEFEEVYTILGEILSSDKPKAGQNIGFDLRMLERSPYEAAVTARTALGFQVNNVRHDTRLLSSLLSEVSPANLTALTAYWTDIPYYEAEVAGMKSRMWEVEDKTLWEYGGADVDVVQTLVPLLHPKVQDEGTDWVYENISIPLIRCATKLEERGVYIDQEAFDKLCRYYKAHLKEKKEELNETVGRVVEHPTHYQHVQKLVFEDLGLPLTNEATDGAANECDKCRKLSSPCSSAHAKTSADSLKELNERSPHPVLPLLIDIRTDEKLYSTYLEGGGGGGFRPHIRADGRIHARWNAARAATGRFACEEPNLMNLPKGVEIQSDEYDIHSKDALRAMLGAPPGYGLLNADWSQAEVWVMAYETKDETLLRLLMEGKDIHAYVARELCKLGVSSKFPKGSVDEPLSLEEWRDKYKDIRDRGKTFVFGMNYGLTAEGAAQRLGCSKEEVSPLLAYYVQHIFPGMGPYFICIREEMFRDGSVSDRFERRRHFAEVPLLAALRYRGDLEGAVRQGYNMPIQGGAHDLHSLAHIATERELSPFIEPVLEMHDSLMSYPPLDRLEEAAAAIKELWEDVARNTILPSGERLAWEIPVEVQWGRSFGDLEVRLE